MDANLHETSICMIKNLYDQELLEEIKTQKLFILSKWDIIVSDLECYWCKKDLLFYPIRDIIADYGCDDETIYKIFCSKKCFRENIFYNVYGTRRCIYCNLPGCEKVFNKTEGVCHKCIKINCNKCFKRDDQCKCFCFCKNCFVRVKNNKKYKGNCFLCKMCRNKTFKC